MRTELARGDQLLKKIPELSGVGLREIGYRVASPEEVAVARSAIGSRGGSPIRRKWISEMAKRLRERRGEFVGWRRAINPGSPLGLARVDKKVVHMDALLKLTELAASLPEVTLQRAAKTTEFAKKQNIKKTNASRIRKDP